MARPVIFCGARVKQQIDELYGNPPTSTTIGGVTIGTINLAVMGAVGIVYDPILTSTILLLIDVAKVAPCFMITPGKPAVFFEPLAKTGAAESEQLFTMFGVDYTNADLHGCIKNLSTS
jgi:hypothetical protein